MAKKWFQLWRQTLLTSFCLFWPRKLNYHKRLFVFIFSLNLSIWNLTLTRISVLRVRKATHLVNRVVHVVPVLIIDLTFSVSFSRVKKIFDDCFISSHSTGDQTGWGLLQSRLMAAESGRRTVGHSWRNIYELQVYTLCWHDFLNVVNVVSRKLGSKGLSCIAERESFSLLLGVHMFWCICDQRKTNSLGRNLTNKNEKVCF